MAEDRLIDAVIVTGDISQDHKKESYHRFMAEVSRLKRPVLLIPGNHDDPKQFEGLIQDAQVQSPIWIQNQRWFEFDHWQLILLNSQKLGIPGGELVDDELFLFGTMFIGLP